jgi:hypothetical protein
MNILIFSQARTGSSYLSGMFRKSNIDFLKYSEPFNNIPPNFEKYKRKIFKAIKKSPNTVCKEHFYDFDEQLSDADKTEFLNNDWYIISLLRQNLVESALSQMIAEKTKKWDGSSYKSNKLIIIDEIDFLHRLEDRVNKVIKFAEWQQLNKLVNEFVYYEDLTFDFEKDYKNLKLSNTQPLTFRTNTAKKSPLKDSILINYNKLKQVGDEHMLTVSHPYINNNNGLITLK